MPIRNPVSIHGKIYESVAEASKILGTLPGRVYSRLKSDALEWSDWFFVDSERNNKTPNKKIEVNCYYQFIHVPTGAFYVGSTNNFSGRKANHKWRLRENNHTCKALQSLWNSSDKSDDTWRWLRVIVQNRQEAYDNEQAILMAYNGSPLLLNSAMDARSPISDLMTRVGFKDNAKAAFLKKYHSHTKEEREEFLKQMSKKSHKRWSNNDNRESWTGSGNPFAKKVMIDNVVYGSVKEAMRTLRMDEKKIRMRARDPAFPNYTFDIPETPPTGN